MRILFTSSLSTPFIREDLSLLRRSFRTDHLVTRGLTALWRIPLSVIRADVTFTWFASVYAFWVVFWARLTGRKSIVVVGGVDAAKEPALGYGIWLSFWKAPLVRWTVRHAWRLLPVDETLADRIRLLARFSGPNIRVVPTGYDAGFWSPHGPPRPRVLCVAACGDPVRVRVKGIDLLAEAARRLEGVEFLVVGIERTVVAASALAVPPNMEIRPPVPREELRALYRAATVYCQPSAVEGLPNGLCEAMLCGCVPVGTDAGGIPAVIGDTGWVVPRGDAGRLAAALREALGSGEERRTRARARIAERFPAGAREAALRQLLTEAARA